MSLKNSFVFKETVYRKGSIIKIKESYLKEFKYKKYLMFNYYDNERMIYNVNALNDIYCVFEIPKDKFSEYIDEINQSEYHTNNSKHVEPDCVEGISSAWIWYILIIIFCLLLNGIANRIIGIWVTSLIFFAWRNNKINGG